MTTRNDGRSAAQYAGAEASRRDYTDVRLLSFFGVALPLCEPSAAIGEKQFGSRGRGQGRHPNQYFSWDDEQEAQRALQFLNRSLQQNSAEERR